MSIGYEDPKVSYVRTGRAPLDVGTNDRHRARVGEAFPGNCVEANDRIIGGRVMRTAFERQR